MNSISYRAKIPVLDIKSQCMNVRSLVLCTIGSTTKWSLNDVMSHLHFLDHSDIESASKSQVMLHLMVYVIPVLPLCLLDVCQEPSFPTLFPAFAFLLSFLTPLPEPPVSVLLV